MGFQFQVFSGFLNQEYTENIIKKQQHIIDELRIYQNEESKFINKSNAANRELLRIGIIGFGFRGEQLGRALGYAHPEFIEKESKLDGLKDWFAQEDLKVAITGICDVFDLYAENELATAKNETRVWEVHIGYKPEDLNIIKIC